MKSGIFFSLFLVLVNGKKYSVFYLSDQHQTNKIFIPRRPLSPNAKRFGWQGFVYDISKIKKKFKRLI